MILLDTTILVYAVGDEHPLRDPCRKMVELIASGSVHATTTVEVIQEFAHVRARRRTRADAAALSAHWIDLLSPLAQPSDHDLRRGLEIFSTIDALGAFDAVLAATALNDPAITGLASADQAFAAITGLRHHDPATEGFLD